MKAAIGLWLWGVAFSLMVAFIEDEPKIAIAASLFLALLCAGAYLIAS